MANKKLAPQTFYSPHFTTHLLLKNLNTDQNLEYKIASCPNATQEGGLICPRNQTLFIHNPLQQISYNDGKQKQLHEIGSSIMVLEHNCTEQLVVFSSTWHKIVDVETGRKVREIYDQDGFVSAVCWSPTNVNIFASAGTDSSIRTWDIRAHPAQTLQLRRQRRYKAIAYSPDSNMLSFAGESINLVELSNPRNITQINCPSPVLSLRFNPLEYLLATGSEDRVIRFFDIDTSECVSQSLPLESNIQNIDFDTQGRHLIASCGSVISAFNWEPFDCIGRLDLSTLKSRNFSGNNSVPSSDGSTSTTRHNPAFKSLDLRVIDDDILQLSFDESAQKLLLHTTKLSDLFAATPQQLPVESPTPWDDTRSNCSDPIASPTTFNPTIGNIQPFETTSDRHQSSLESHGLSQKSMTGSCCLGPLVSNRLPTNLLDSSTTHLPRPQHLTASHSESRILKPTRARSNVRLNSTKDIRGSNSTLNQRTPSNEAVNNIHSNDEHPHKTRASSTRPGHSATTPVEGRPPFSLKRNGSLPNNENGASVAEKHTEIMEMLNSRIRDCKRINSLIKTSEDEALEEVSRMNDGLHMFAQLLRAYKQQPAAYTLQFCARIIPTLRKLLSHKNPNYVDLALDTLANILNEFTVPIKHALAPNAVSMGVDLAAEQRQMHCTKCKEALTELYLNSSFILEKLNPSQRDYFNMLTPMIEQISEL